MFKSIRYFAIAVKDLEQSIERFGKLYGLKPMREPNLGRWGFRSAMLASDGERMIELMSPPEDSGSSLERFMKERAIPSNPNGEGLYMIAVTVDDIEKTIKQIESEGGRVARSEDNPNTCWVHPTTSNFTYFELTQESSE
jgi:predicted enzyme related to lactoylglutathione lyase